MQVGGVFSGQFPSSTLRRGRVIDGGNTSPTIQHGDSGIYRIEENEMGTKYRIRKITPKESWRLMGFTDEQFNRAKEVNSDTQLYKQAGNSIVVDCLYHIFKEMV